MLDSAREELFYLFIVKKIKTLLVAQMRFLTLTCLCLVATILATLVGAPPADAYKEEIVVCPEGAVFRDASGKLATPTVGKPIFLWVPISNPNGHRSITVHIFLVAYSRDKVPINMGLGTATIGPGSSSYVAVGWIPPKPGNYTVKVFFWNFAKLLPLCKPLVLKVEVK